MDVKAIWNMAYGAFNGDCHQLYEQRVNAAAAAIADALSEQSQQHAAHIEKLNRRIAELEAERAGERERIEAAVTAKVAEFSANLEAGYKGKPGIFPDWINQARIFREHAISTSPAWLDDLLKILGWSGGNIHDALNAVRRVVHSSSSPTSDPQDDRTTAHDPPPATCTTCGNPSCQPSLVGAWPEPPCDKPAITCRVCKMNECRHPLVICDRCQVGAGQELFVPGAFCVGQF